MCTSCRDAFDQLSDYYEATSNDLDPLKPDSNDDGLADYLEVGGGYYKICAKSGGGKCLSVKDGSTFDEAFVVQSDYSNYDYQKWGIQPAGDGWCKIVARHSGMCLSLDGDECTNNGDFVFQISSCDDLTYQEWELKPVEKGYYEIVNKMSGKCLMIKKINLYDGDLQDVLVQWEYTGADNQKWE